MRLHLSVQKQTRTPGAPRTPSIARWARAALAGSGRGSAAVTVRLVDAAEGAALNKRYRGKRGPTNVLSFSYDLARATPGLNGDLVICAPLVVHEAARLGLRPRAHWAHLVVHGILHLRGYDHVQETDAQAMEAVEIRTLKRLGFQNPYDRHS